MKKKMKGGGKKVKKSFQLGIGCQNNKIALFKFMYQAIGLMSRVFANGPGFNPRSSHSKDSKNDTWCHLALHSAL